MQRVLEIGHQALTGEPTLQLVVEFTGDHLQMHLALATVLQADLAELDSLLEISLTTRHEAGA